MFTSNPKKGGILPRILNNPSTNAAKQKKQALYIANQGDAWVIYTEDCTYEIDKDS